MSPLSPAGGLGGELDEDLANQLAAQQQTAAGQGEESSDDRDTARNDGAVTPSALAIINRMAE